MQDSPQSAKDSRDPKTCGGVYRIPCSCGNMNIGTTKRSVNTRIKEHDRHCCLRDTERSAVAQHIVMNPEHKIGFDDTELLCNMQHYYPRLHREAIQIYKHKNCFNKKEEGLKIYQSWYPTLKMCKVKSLITKSSDIETGQSGFSCPSAGQSRSSSTHAPGI